MLRIRDKQARSCQKQVSYIPTIQEMCKMRKNTEEEKEMNIVNEISRRDQKKRE